MIKLSTFSWSLVFLCAGFCCPEEDDYIELATYTLEVPELIEITNSRTTYALNDTIWIKTEVLVNLEHQGEIINISEVAGNSDRLYAYLDLYQQTGFENPTLLSLSPDEVIIREGEVSTNSALLATAFLNGQNFQSKFGIVLKQPGEFFISNYYQQSLNLFVDTNNGVLVYLLTTFKNSDEGDLFRFTVE